MGKSTKTEQTDRLGRKTGNYRYTETRKDDKIEDRNYGTQGYKGKDVHDPKTGKTDSYDRLNRKK